MEWDVATDGSKFKAYAAKEMLSLKNIAKRLIYINEKLDTYLEEFKKADSLDDLTEEFAGTFDGDKINMALVNKIADLQEKLERLELQKQQLVKSGKNYLAPNDPDAGLMRSRDGKIPAYNAQTVIDKKNKMIAVAEITTETNVLNEIKNNHTYLKDQLDIVLGNMEADKGYANTNQIKEIEENSETKCFVPLQNSFQKEEDEKAGIEFTYDEENDEYKCSQGKTLKLKQKNKPRRSHLYNIYQCTECTQCPLRTKCTKSKIGRTINRNVIQSWIDKYKGRMQETKSKEKIKERKTIVEHPFGTLKWMMGKFHFLLTGKEKVQIEFDLYATAYNLKRLINIDNMELLLQRVENYSWKRE